MNFRPLIISGVFTFLVGTCAHADLVVSNSVNALGNTLTNSARSVSPLGATVDNNTGSLLPLNYDYSSAFAYANYGVLKAYVLSTDNIRSTSASSQATAQFLDTITINAPGLAGQQGTINADFIFNWRIFAGLSGNAVSGAGGQVVFNFNNNQYVERAQGGVDQHGGQTITSSGGYNGSNNLPFSFDIRILNDFTFGYPIQISGFLAVNSGVAVGGGGGYAEGSNDAAHSAYWNGIQSISSNNRVINDFTVLSTSGANYKNSFVPLAVVPDPNNVPEPASLVLVGIGMLGLAISRKKFSRGK